MYLYKIQNCTLERRMLLTFELEVDMLNMLGGL